MPIFIRHLNRQWSKRQLQYRSRRRYSRLRINGFDWAKDGTICTPDTHSNGFEVKDNQIMNLLTGAAGESFDIFTRFSIMATGHKNPSSDTKEFLLGLNAMNRKPRPARMRMLMTVRMLQLSGE